MIRQLYSMVSRWLPTLKPSNADPTSSTNSTLPPPPRELITNRVVYEMPLLDRRVSSDSDTPLKALYRIYEHIVLDQWAEIRNEFEAFWFHSSWAVHEIPDPKDPDLERYACLACIPKLLCVAFNERIKIGLPRDAPAIFTGDMMEEWKKREPKYEEWPLWVEEVSPVEDMLAIPHWDNDKRDFVPLSGFDDERLSPEFASKNILIWQPHIHFM